MLLCFFQGVFEVLDFIEENAIFKILFFFVISFLAYGQGDILELLIDIDKELFDVVNDGLQSLLHLFLKFTDHAFIP